MSHHDTSPLQAMAFVFLFKSIEKTFFQIFLFKINILNNFGTYEE